MRSRSLLTTRTRSPFSFKSILRRPRFVFPGSVFQNYSGYLISVRREFQPRRGRCSTSSAPAINRPRALLRQIPVIEPDA